MFPAEEPTLEWYVRLKQYFHLGFLHICAVCHSLENSQPKFCWQTVVGRTKIRYGDGEMAHTVKSWLHSNERPNLGPRQPCEKHMWSCAPVIPELEKQRQEDGSLGLCRQPVSSRFSQSHYLKEIRQRASEKDSWVWPLASMSKRVDLHNVFLSWAHTHL